MKLFIQTGAGTGARYAEATRAQIMGAAADILYEIGMSEAASELMAALVHRALSTPTLPPEIPEQATQKPRRARRPRQPTPEGGKKPGEAPAQPEKSEFANRAETAGLL